jgi:hypothetical protein
MKRMMLLQSATAALCAVGFCALSSGPLLGAPARPASLPASRPSTDIVRAVDDKEQEDVLLGRHSDGVVARTAARMDESARRLGKEFDAGAQTQEVQRRILSDLDELIDALNRARAKPGKPNSGGSGGALEPKRADGQQIATSSAPSPASTAASASDKPAPATAATAPSGEFVDRRQAFVQISPRLRPAVIEGASEQVSEKYRGLTEAYYKAVASAGK